MNLLVFDFAQTLKKETSCELSIIVSLLMKAKCTLLATWLFIESRYLLHQFEKISFF
jgi:hypothetical protein